MMDARIGILMREGQTVYYAFPDGYNKPAFEGLLVEVEQRLGLRAHGTAASCSKSTVRGSDVKQWVVTMRFEYPAWDEKDGIVYQGIPARTRSEANRAAKRLHRVMVMLAQAEAVTGSRLSNKRTRTGRCRNEAQASSRVGASCWT